MGHAVDFTRSFALYYAGARTEFRAAAEAAGAALASYRHPGATAPDMNTAARDPEQSARIAQGIALGRVGQPEDIAGVVAFLASDEGGWVTGQRIDASGSQRL